MKMTRAWGWLAAGVLAAGLNARYHDGGLQWAHQIAGRIEHHSTAVLALAFGRADQFLSEARLMAPRAESASCPFSKAVAEMQHRIEHSQAEFEDTEVQDFDVMSARKEAQWARLEANRVRMEAQFRARTIRLGMTPAAFTRVSLKGMPGPVVCPRVRVNIPRVPMMMMKMPMAREIQVDVANGDPI
jgi:hypothetical protein